MSASLSLQHDDGDEQHGTLSSDLNHELAQAPSLLSSAFRDGPTIDPRLLSSAPSNHPLPVGSFDIPSAAPPRSPIPGSTPLLVAALEDEGRGSMAIRPSQSFRNHAPERNIAMQEFVWQLSSEAIAGPSSGNATISFHQDAAFDDQCRCVFREGKPQKPRRHWTSSCPFNPNLTSWECDWCDTVVKRKDNMERHLKNFHPELLEPE